MSKNRPDKSPGGKEARQVNKSHVKLSGFPSGTSASYKYDVKKDRFTYMDDSMEEITGIPVDEFLNKSPQETLAEVAEISHLDAIGRFVVKSLAPRLKPDDENQITVNLIYNILTRDQVHKRLHVQYVVSAFDGNLPAVTTGISTDITHLQKDGLPVFYLVQNNKVIYREEANPDDIIKNSSIPLSRAEINVLRLTSGGLAPKEIAQKMKISVSTLYTHRKNIKMKMGQDINFVISMLRDKGIIS